MVRSAANDNHYRLTAFNFTNDRLTQCLKLALTRNTSLSQETREKKKKKKKRERDREKKKKNDRGWGSKGTTPGRTTKNPKNILRFYDFPSPRSFFSIFRTDSRSQNIGVIKSSGRCITKHIYIFKICRCLAHSCLWTWRAKQFDQFEKA